MLFLICYDLFNEKLFGTISYPQGAKEGELGVRI